MKFTINTILLVVGILFLWGCKKQTLAPAYNEEPVISGYLFAGNSVSIRITSQIAVSSETSGTGTGIDTLQIYIDCDTQSHLLTNVGNGVYIDSTLIVSENKQYQLHFLYNGELVTASTVVPLLARNVTQSVTEITIQKIDLQTMPSPGSFQMNDPINIEWDNTDQSYFMIIVENIESSPELIRDTTNERFRVRSFRNEPAVTSEYQLRDQQFQYFGTHSIVLYHLNPDYAALYSGNSNSSQNLSNPTTNITNGIGIFTGISTDTLFLEVKKKQ